MKSRCDDCGRVCDEPAVDLCEVPDLYERLDPGGVVPSGECECGALCYPVESDDETLRAIRDAAEQVCFSADNEGCTDDLTVVSRDAIERLAALLPKHQPDPDQGQPDPTT